MNERDELYLLLKGSTSAFEHLYNLYSGKLFNFCLKLTNGNKYISEELTQRTFVKVWEKRSSIDPERSFVSFICTIAKNMLLNDFEHETVKFIYAEYVKSAAHIQQENATELEVERNLLENLIDKITEELPPKRKEIFILSRKRGYSNKHIAEYLHISESTIETQLTKSLAFMKEKLKYYGSYFVFLCYFWVM